MKDLRETQNTSAAMAEVAYVPGGMGGDGPDDPNRDKGIQKPDGHDEQPIKAEAKVETEEERQVDST
jgi:hypothetical protein